MRRNNLRQYPNSLNLWPGFHDTWEGMILCQHPAQVLATYNWFFFLFFFLLWVRGGEPFIPTSYTWEWNILRQHLFLKGYFDIRLGWLVSLTLSKVMGFDWGSSLIKYILFYAEFCDLCYLPVRAFFSGGCFCGLIGLRYEPGFSGRGLNWGLLRWGISLLTYFLGLCTSQ